jgi:hypothetical protein
VNDGSGYGLRQTVTGAADQNQILIGIPTASDASGSRNDDLSRPGMRRFCRFFRLGNVQLVDLKRCSDFFF